MKKCVVAALSAAFVLVSGFAAINPARAAGQNKWCEANCIQLCKLVAADVKECLGRQQCERYRGKPCKKEKKVVRRANTYNATYGTPEWRRQVSPRGP